MILKKSKTTYDYVLERSEEQVSVEEFQTGQMFMCPEKDYIQE